MVLVCSYEKGQRFGGRLAMWKFLKELVEELLSDPKSLLVLLGVLVFILGAAGGVTYNNILVIYDQYTKIAVMLAGAALAARAMMGRIGEPEDIANAVVFLVSPESGWITAQMLTVDGGRMDYIGHG